MGNDDKNIEQIGTDESDAAERVAGQLSDEATEPLTQAGAAQAAAQPARASGVPRILAILALLVALVSASMAGFLWWQYRQFYVALNDADDSGQAAVRQARTDIVAMEDKLGDLRQDDRKLRASVETLSADLARLPARFVDFEERLQSLQGVSEDSRRAWLRAEVQYLLSLANMELALAGRWDTAREALTLADTKLRELGNPLLTPVRDAIAGALQRLNAVPLADTEGLSLALGSLAGRVGELPLKASAERSEFESGPVVIDRPPGLERAWASLKAALAGLVRIEKRDVPVRRALTLREEALLRLSLELELEASRLSLLRADGAGFRSSLAAAQRSLSGDFDGSDAGVQAALETLTGIVAVTIDPPRPDISQPLLLMQRLTVPSARRSSPAAGNPNVTPGVEAPQAEPEQPANPAADGAL